MKIASIRFNLGSTDISIDYVNRPPTIFRSKYGDELVGLYDRKGWIDFGDGRVQLFRSRIDSSSWLDEKGFHLERQSLVTEAGVYTLRQSEGPSPEILRALGLQSYSPPRQLVVNFDPEMTWTTSICLGELV